MIASIEELMGEIDTEIRIGNAHVELRHNRAIVEAFTLTATALALVTDALDELATRPTNDE